MASQRLARAVGDDELRQCVRALWLSIAVSAAASAQVTIATSEAALYGPVKPSPLLSAEGVLSPLASLESLPGGHPWVGASPAFTTTGCTSLVGAPAALLALCLARRRRFSHSLRE